MHSETFFLTENSKYLVHLLVTACRVHHECHSFALEWAVLRSVTTGYGETIQQSLRLASSSQKMGLGWSHFIGGQRKAQSRRHRAQAWGRHLMIDVLLLGSCVNQRPRPVLATIN